MGFTLAGYKSIGLLSTTDSVWTLRDPVERTVNNIVSISNLPPASTGVSQDERVQAVMLGSVGDELRQINVVYYYQNYF